MSRTGHSDPNIWGGYNHYDEHGHKIGHSEPNFWGGYTEYDDKGHKVGHSEPNVWGGFNHYDEQGHKTGYSDPNVWGGYKHYDNDGNRKGSSDPSVFGYSHNDSDGCYVATCVYGSYDCPEVWTLRRFRDYTLDSTWYGRAFIKTYYSISPTLVRWFGETDWFKKMWKPILDKMVTNLKAQGVEDTFYTDKY